jgi:hypothetical protein
MDIIKAIKDILSAPIKPVAAPGQAELSTDDINYYKNCIKNAKRYHKKVFYERAKRYIAFYNSDLKGEGMKGVFPGVSAYDVFCNELWVNVQTIRPSIYFNNPFASVEAEFDTITEDTFGTNGELMGTVAKRLPDGTELKGDICASSLESILKRYHRKLNLKNKAKRALVDALVMSHGILMAGWNTELEIGENDDVKVINDDLTIRRLNPLNVLIDPECVDIGLESAKYIILKYFKPTVLIKKNPIYSGVDNLVGSKKLVFSNSEDDREVNEADYEGQQLDLERNEIYEIWDRLNKRVVTFVDKLDKPIRVHEGFLWGLDRYPVSILAFNESIEGGYPMFDFAAYEGMAILKTRLRMKMWELFKKLNRIYGYNTKALKDENKLQTLIDSDIGGLVGFDVPDGMALGDVLQNLNDFVLNNSYLALDKLVNMDIERYSGITDYARGVMSQVKRLATEVIQQGATQNLRIEEKKDALADWLEDFCQLEIKILQNQADEIQILKIKDESGVKFLKWSKENIPGEYTVNIDIGTLVKQDISNKQKEDFAKYDKTLLNPLADQVENLKDLLKAFNVKNPEDKLNKSQVAIYKNPQVTQALQQLGLLDEKGNLVNQPQVNASPQAAQLPMTPTERIQAEVRP